MVALLGASATLGGLILVFLGVNVATVQGYPADTPASVLSRFRKLAWFVVAVFIVSMVAVALPSFWLITLFEPLYGWSVGGFFIQIVGVVALAVAATLVLSRA